MKFQTTQKKVCEWYAKRIDAGNDTLQELLRFESPIAYTAGTYGWNADIYSFGNVAIITGDRPFGNVKPDYELRRKYERLAEGKSKEERRKLIDEFIKEVYK